MVYEMERRLSAIWLLVLLLGMGLFGLSSSRADRALAEPGPRPVSDAPWGANVKVNDDTSEALQTSAAIAVDASGNAYAVWTDTRYGDYDIYFSYRLAGVEAGPTPQAWLENVQVSDDTSGTKQAHPAIAVDGSGSTYAVWTDTRYGDYDIYFSYRPAGGDWGPNLKVSDDTSGAWQGTPATAVDASGNAYAVWKDARNGDYDIYFSYRPAGGDWAPNVRVNDDAGTSDQWNPAIAVDGSGNAYAVWEDHRKANVDIYFSYRPAGGDWGPNLKVNDDTSGALQMVPAIALDSSGNAYAVWQDTRNGDYYDLYDIYFSYRPAGGDWGPNAKVNDDTSVGVQESPAIAVDASGNAYAVWGDYRSASGDIYFSYRPAGGDWGPDVKVDDAAWGALQTAPAIALDSSGNAYAVWKDFRNGDYDIYFSYRPAGGDWGPNVKVNDDAGTSTQWFPAIAVDGRGNAYAVWMDERKGNFDIYFSYRPAEGVTPTPTPTATPTPTPTATPTRVAILTPQPTPSIVEATPAPMATPTPLQIPSPTATPYYEEGWLTPRSVLVFAGLVFCGGVTALIILVVGLLVLRKR